MSTTTEASPTDTRPTELPAVVGELNHVELVYAPGERGLAHRFFELLGATVIETGNKFLIVKMAGDGNGLDNVLYASEVTEHQWALELQLRAALSATGTLSEAAGSYRQRMQLEPQTSSHFGFRIDDKDVYEQRLRAIDEAGKDDPFLAGRVELSGVFRPGDPGSLTDIMIQAFVHTDIVASGILAFGQFVEIQHTWGTL